MSKKFYDTHYPKYFRNISIFNNSDKDNKNFFSCHFPCYDSYNVAGLILLTYLDSLFEQIREYSD